MNDQHDDLDQHDDPTITPVRIDTDDLPALIERLRRQRDRDDRRSVEHAERRMRDVWEGR